MFHTSSKRTMLAVLVACFALQAGLVYSDDRDLRLSDAAIRGRRLYHDGACQVCHQLWGQGGFLGPDLTNAASRVDETRLASLLTGGSGQMPAFHLTPEQIADVRAYLTEIDRPDLGSGQLRLGDANDAAGPQAAFDAALGAMELPPDVAAGFEAFRSRICVTCHVPFRTSTVGAPDLTSVRDRLDWPALRTVLTEGRPERGMPPPAPAFTEHELASLAAYFSWLNANRPRVQAEAASRRRATRIDWSRLPWWEFR